MPQWNCSCPNCRDARRGILPARTQSSIALSDGSDLCLINASPDLRFQIESYRALQPGLQPTRNSPLQTVLLTNADLDHLLGLFLVREGAPLTICAPEAVWAAAANLGLETILNAFCGFQWRAPGLEFAPFSPTGTEGNLWFRAIPLAGKPPPFAPHLNGGVHSVAYQFLDQRTQRRLVVAPDVAALGPELVEAIAESDAVVFDGTFWSADELGQIKPGARTADQMGHVTIRDVSLDLLRQCRARHKIYTHINNTNPILALKSRERAAVEAAGIVVGFDGLEFEL